MLKSQFIRQEIANVAKRGEELMSIESMNDEQARELKDVTAKLSKLGEDLAQAEAIENALRNTGEGQSLTPNKNKKARTLGEHFVNTVGNRFVESRGQGVLETPEFRNADTSPHLTSDNSDYAQFATEFDSSFIDAPKPARIADLFTKGTTSKPTVTYFTKTFDTSAELISKRKGATAEGVTKNKRHYTKTVATDNAGKFTGLTDISEEMVDDLSFIATEINGDLVTDVELDEDYQLLHGDGTSPNIKGLLNRDGVLTLTSASVDENEDAIFRGANLIETITPYAADGIIMNPLDYEKIRLKKDANGQYLGGGIFTGAYGNGGVQWKPPVWAKNTVTSAFCPQGKVIIGSFNSPAAKLLQYGGMKVATTNANKDNFEKNMITLRAEQRAILQCKIPQCFCIVTLATAGI